MMYNQGDIILIPIPFTDLSSSKKRPVIVISNDQYNSLFEDIIVVAVTSNLASVRFSIPINNSDLDEGELKVSSLVRPDKIYTLHKGIAVRKFGRVSGKMVGEIKSAITKIIN
ncbi:MAG TPA: type II toxin-antitoxin system PemK/MazF family toxin [Thermodesulfovibrionales bacterium]|nr:type II toxin-antitoxin system PemK/MazF family toxin [Thermodesulfovibrionales bacterium]